MNDPFIQNLISTILGVIIGGLITIKVSNLTNTKLLRNQHTLEVLQNIKNLLRKLGEDILLDSTAFFESENIDDFKDIPRSNALKTLIIHFDINNSVLKPFKEKFNEIKKIEIKVMINEANLKKELIIFSDKYKTKEVEKLYEYTEVSLIIERYAEEVFNLFTHVENLIAEIDSYIDIVLLKNSFC